jgi:hypothetical protein
MQLRQGSNELGSSSPTARPSPVILSEAKDLAADRDRPFAEFTLSEAHGLRVTTHFRSWLLKIIIGPYRWPG